MSIESFESFSGRVFRETGKHLDQIEWAESVGHIVVKCGSLYVCTNEDFSTFTKVLIEQAPKRPTIKMITPSGVIGQLTSESVERILEFIGLPNEDMSIEIGTHWEWGDKMTREVVERMIAR